MLKKLFTLIIFLVSPFVSMGQVDCDTTTYPKLLNNSYQCKWKFFKISDTIEGVIIKHEEQVTGCGVMATASLTIMKVGNDTIRVIDMCNSENYLAGQKVKVVAGVEPSFQVHIPYYIFTEAKKGKMTKQEKHEQGQVTIQEQPVWHSNEYDNRVIKTTWGQIIDS